MRRLVAIVFAIGALTCLWGVIYASEDGNVFKDELSMYSAAYRHVTVDFDPEELCLSDSVHNLDWNEFWGIVNKETFESLEAKYLKGFTAPEDESGSGSLTVLRDSLEVPNTNPRYIVRFSAPYKRLIRCDVVPITSVETDGGVRGGMVYLFQFDSEGVCQICKRRL